MDKLIAYIEKNQTKKFIDHLTILLKNSSFNINQTFNKKDSKYSSTWTHTLFSYACMYGNLEICKYLFSKGADPIEKESKIGEGFPLAISILHNQFHISDWLQSTFNIDCSINNSWSLKFSAEHGNLNGVKYAINHNADIHAEDDSALRWAAYNGRLSIVKYLISKGADIHALDDYALIWAAKNGHLSTVKYLISKGADIHAFNDFALRWAVCYGHFKTAEYLLDHGANPNANDDGYILQQLLEKDQFELAAKAVSYGADPRALSSFQQQKLNVYMLSKKMTKAKKL